jgi:hypothetical protein
MTVTVIEVTTDGKLTDHYVGDAPPLETLESRIGERIRSTCYPAAAVALRESDDTGTGTVTISVPNDIRPEMAEETIEEHATNIGQGFSALSGIPEEDITVEIDLSESAEA